MEKSIDVIIPTYRPDAKFISLLLALKRQSISPNNIIVVNTDKSIWNKLDMDTKVKNTLGADISKLILKHIEKKDFDHGRTRNYGVSFSKTKYFICMTMDAVPKDEYLIENLLKTMSDKVKLSYARQMANEDADILEKFTRNFNYPDKSIIKSKSTEQIYGIKNYFCSNVCACYERESFDKIGGFKENIILNEDMIYAYDLLNTGKSLEYVAGAVVLHSHSYTGKEQFKRNFDIGVSQAMDKSIFSSLKSETEGIKMIKLNIKYLKEQKELYYLPKLIYISACKFLGYKLGKSYKKLPKSIVKLCSLNKAYWR